MIYSVDLQEMAGKISFVDLCKYVSDVGWTKYQGKVAEGIAIYQKYYKENFYQIKVPCNREFEDYSEAIYSAVEKISKTENKSVEQVILELLNPMSDILRVRQVSKNVENGSILVEDAINLFDNAKKMLLNATLDILNYKKVYKGRIPEEVSNFINNCRYGQTEIGSYVISLVCPFMDIIGAGKIKQLSLFSEEDTAAHSLTRRATKKVIDSINLIKDTLEQGEDLTKLIENTENPISVSFMESLANLNLSQEDNSIEITAKWAPTVNVNRAKKDSAVISHDYYSPLKTIVEKYKTDDEKMNVTLEGKIYQLDAKPKVENRKKGNARLIYIAGDSSRKISVELKKPDYDEAIYAHANGRTVRISGERKNKIILASNIEIL